MEGYPWVILIEGLPFSSVTSHQYLLWDSLLHVCERFACMYVYVPLGCLVSAEVRKGVSDPLGLELEMAVV